MCTWLFIIGLNSTKNTTEGLHYDHYHYYYFLRAYNMLRGFYTNQLYSMTLKKKKF